MFVLFFVFFLVLIASFTYTSLSTSLTVSFFSTILCAISSCFSLSPKKSPDYNKILKNFNHIHSSNTFDIDEKKKNTKMTKNTVFPKKDIKRIQINGLNDLLQNSNSNSRNNSNSERIIFNEALTNKISRTNRNNNNLYSKTYLDICKKKF